MNGPVILNNAREQLADEIFAYREPKPAPLKISPWLAMSLLQKATRPGGRLSPCSVRRNICWRNGDIRYHKLKSPLAISQPPAQPHRCVAVECPIRKNGSKRDAGFANQRGALNFGLPVGVSSCKAAGDFAATKCQVHTNGLGVLVRDKFAPPFAILEGVRSSVIEIRVATQNVAVGQNNYPGCVASFAIPHVNTY
jgi:hypothetical protein